MAGERRSPVTTLALGEEDSVTTLALGEEDEPVRRRTPVTTLALGEEDPASDGEPSGPKREADAPAQRPLGSW